jgi:ribosomal protein S18 acetylase RimI-like enzyme
VTASNQEQANVREATPDDAARIAEILFDAFAEYEPLYNSDSFAATAPTANQIVERLNEGPVWVVTDGGRTVGTVSVVPQGDRLYIRGMAIVPNARGRRIGWLLLEHVESFARANAIARLVLSTTPFLDRAIALYERFGFERTNEGPHDLLGTPLFTMVKVL